MRNDSINYGDTVQLEIINMGIVKKPYFIEIEDSKKELHTYSDSDLKDENLFFKTLAYKKGINTIKEAFYDKNKRIPFDYNYYVK